MGPVENFDGTPITTHGKSQEKLLRLILWLRTGMITFCGMSDKPQILSEAAVCELFAIHRRLFREELAEKLPHVPLEKRPPGKPTRYYPTSAVAKLFKSVFGRTPRLDELLAALDRVQQQRTWSVRSYRRKAKQQQSMGAQP
jgi:hypothetical protein